MDKAYNYLSICRICGDSADCFGPLPDDAVPGTFDYIDTICPQCPDDGIPDRAATFNQPSSAQDVPHPTNEGAIS